MANLQDLPELGVGVIYWPSLDGFIDLDEQPVDVLEVEPQAFWFPPSSSTGSYQLDRRAFDRLRQLPQPKLVHGVGFPIGGTVPPDPRQVGPFVESISLLQAPWASEHLSFNRVHEGTTDVDVGFLLPPLQTLESVAVATSNIAALKTSLPVPFAFETGVSYLRPLEGELSDGAFFAAVAVEADCGILLDLHNVWANERNGRQPVLELLDELPLERILELHLAGGQEYDGYWVDAHSDLIPPPVLDLARTVVPRLPNLKAIIFEVMPDYVAINDISPGQLAEQFHKLQELWKLRGSQALMRDEMRIVNNTEGISLLSPDAWEAALATAVSTKRPSEAGMVDSLYRDPGIVVLRKLIAGVRAGKIADVLTLTTRLLLLTLGDRGVQEVLDGFWDSVPSEPMASHEALNFAAYLTGGRLTAQVDYLQDVLGFELAAHRAVMTRSPQHVTFSVDPELLLSALRDGRRPTALTPGHYEVTVNPPA